MIFNKTECIIISMPKPEYLCIKCNLTFNDKMANDKHQWECHPSDSFQQYWSEKLKKGELHSMSLGYQDDPYY